MNINGSVILDTDSYKLSMAPGNHPNGEQSAGQYPPGTEYVSSYIEARGNDRGWEDMMFFGLQGFLRYLAANPVTKDDVDEASSLVAMHGVPFNRAGWQYIVDRYDGHLPLEISALDEGSIVPMHTALVQVVNTDPVCSWLTTHIETPLLRIWAPITVATQSLHMRRSLKKYLLASGGTEADMSFGVLDFGSRGVSSKETAAICGAAHLATGFLGTDTVIALKYCRHMYDEMMAGHSVIAAEHSTITSWGRDREADAYRHIMGLCQPGGIVSIVSDSYDIFNAVDMYGTILKEDVKRLASIGARLVIRPDSGVPEEIVPKLLAILEQYYPVTYTTTGHKMLPDYLRILQGDGVDPNSQVRIYEAVMAAGWAVANIILGSGGALLQKVNRDTLKMAMKCSAVKLAGNTDWLPVYKDPVTSPMKKSRAGRFEVHRSERNEYITTAHLNNELDPNSLLKVRFRNGVLYNETTLANIRERAAQAL